MKKPLVIEKRSNQSHKIPAERRGQRNTAVFRLFVFLFSYFDFFFFFFFSVSVVSHSAIKERCMVSSRLGRSLEHKVWGRNRRHRSMNWFVLDGRGSFWGVFFLGPDYRMLIFNVGPECGI